jgi:chromate transporter
MTASGKETVPDSSLAAVFLTFMRLGVIGFGGPAAHLGLFRETLVKRRGWVSEAVYDELLALCQFLPGPGSSQTAAALGWVRAGPAGAITALAGFALPTALVMAMAGYGAAAYGDLIPAGVRTGLLAAAAAVVGSAVLSMALSQARRPASAGLALFGLAATLGGMVSPLPLAAVQPGVILIAAAIGARLLRARGGSETAAAAPRRGRAPGAIIAMGLFVCGLVLLPLLAGEARVIALADAVYRAGALVFGGGHVVLPLLDAGTVPRFLDRETFLAGYGLAQSIPGPVFTFAAFLGAAAGEGPAGAALFALVALLAIFTPGLLLVFAVLPVWARLKQNALASGALAGAAAAVTGILAAAFINPVLTSLPVDWKAYALAAIGFAALRFVNVSPPLVVAACAGAGALLL